MKRNSDDKNRIVFSTNSNFNFEENEKSQSETLPASKQTLYISLERLKGGKTATVVENFIGELSALEDLGKQLKVKCGVGGTVKDGVIIIQGEQRDKAIAYLNSLGYKTKKKGG